MINKNDPLNAWKMKHCNINNVHDVHGVCTDTKHPEVTYGGYCTCDGCPYEVEVEPLQKQEYLKKDAIK